MEQALGIDDPFAVPKPFDGSSLTVVPVNARPQSIAIYPVVGLRTNEAQKLQKAIINRSNDSDVLAVEPDAPRPVSLRGLLRRENKDKNMDVIHVRWFIVDPDGKELGTFDVEEPALPAAKDVAPTLEPETVRSLAAKTIAGVESVLSGGGSTPAQTETAAIAPQTAPTELPIFLAPPKGAPGDGNVSLQRALGAILDQDPRIIVVDSREKARAIIDGEVKVERTSPENADDKVELVWRVASADGTELGRVTQSNSVPPGSLNVHWGETAYYAAQEAAGGIINLFAQLQTAQK
jgi:hypothetical protein